MRAVPFHCPYCAEEDIEPSDDKHSYYCSSCDRRFEVRFRGIGQ